MEIDEKYAAIIMQRVSNSNDEYERIDLVSGSDKQRIPIHRVILMAASNYFAGLLRTNDSKEKPNEFVLDSNGEAIKTVVDYCYTGRIDLTEQNVEKCLKIAFDGEIDLLLNKCHDYISATLGRENVVDVLLTADKYNFIELQQRASELLCSQFEHVSVTHTRQLSPAMMMHLIGAADKTIPSDLVVNRLLNWFQYDEGGRGEHMPKMLRLIPLEQLTSKFLCEMIQPLFHQFKCIDLLNDEFKRRAMYYTPSPGCAPAEYDDAADSDENVLFCVMTDYDDCGGDAVGERIKFIVERYDDSLNKFTTHFTSPWINTLHFGHILYENKIFVIGGCEFGLSTNAMIAIDMKTGEMEQLRPMNERRFSHTSIMLGKLIYVFGGYDDYDHGMEYLSSCERYDTEKGTWQTIKSMNRKRSNAHAAILNGLIYVVGGADGLPGTAGSIESYNPETDEWTEAEANEVVESSLVAFNGLLYGFSSDRGVTQYDPVKNVWTKIQTNIQFQSVISANGSLFAMTKNGNFGQVTINERKIVFVKNAEVENRGNGAFSLHQCQFEG